MDSVILLYYRAPYEDAPELICACDTALSAEHKIEYLMRMHQNLYADRHRFEISSADYYTFNGVITN